VPAVPPQSKLPKRHLRASSARQAILIIRHEPERSPALTPDRKRM